MGTACQACPGGGTIQVLGLFVPQGQAIYIKRSRCANTGGVFYLLLDESIRRISVQFSGKPR